MESIRKLPVNLMWKVHLNLMGNLMRHDYTSMPQSVSLVETSTKTPGSKISALNDHV